MADNEHITKIILKGEDQTGGMFKGAVVGIILGIVLAGLLIARVDFITFAVPWFQIIVFTIAAIVVGIIAAIFPARRAAKLDPLEALQYE